MPDLLIPATMVADPKLTDVINAMREALTRALRPSKMACYAILTEDEGLLFYVQDHEGRRLAAAVTYDEVLNMGSNARRIAELAYRRTMEEYEENRECLTTKVAPIQNV